MRLLIVEDDRTLAWAMSLALEQLGCEVATTSDAGEVMDLARTFGPEAILLDMQLDGASGLDVAQRLREAGYSGTLVAVTGRDGPDDRARSAAAGMDHHLLKPVDVQALLDLLAGPPSPPTGRRTAARLSRKDGEWLVEIPLLGALVRGGTAEEAGGAACRLLQLRLLDLPESDAPGYPAQLPPGEGWHWLECGGPGADP